VATRPAICLVGTGAVILSAPGLFDLEAQKRIWALADAVGAWPEVAETVIGVTNLMVVFAEPPADLDAFVSRLEAAWSELPPLEVRGRTIEIAVTYGGELAGDLAAVSQYTGLSPAEVVDLHAAGIYTVCAIASSPGFAYLHGLDDRLFVPRKATPSLRVPAGAVTIGGMLTGVAVSTGPNGWNAIGSCSARFFDVASDPPALLSVGDRVRFCVERVLL
jgi:KipI family sensor histidine kinase inhibitor